MEATAPSETPTQKPMAMKIIIAGAGIAGPSLALLLSRQGHHCTIIERFPGLRANGQQIDIRKEGIEAAKRMGIFEEVKKHVVEERGMQFVNSQGKQTACFPKMDPKDGQQGFSSEYEIMRGDLCKILYDATKDDVQYRFGLTITEYENHEDRVKVTLSDGSVEDCDVLVGADGQSSRIRKMMLQDEPPEVNKTRDLGLYVAYFTIPRRDDSSDFGTVYTADKRRQILTRYHSKTHGQAYFGTMENGEEVMAVLKEDTTKQKELFAKIFKDAGWQVETLIEDMMASEDFFCQSTTQIQTTIWSKGRVVLLGDAGYGPTPLTGMGTSLALVGAAILAGAIGKHQGNLQAAFTEYDTVFRPVVEKTHQIPSLLPGIVYPKTKFGVKVMNLLLGTATSIGLAKMIQAKTLKNKEEFKLPEYNEVSA